MPHPASILSIGRLLGLLAALAGPTQAAVPELNQTRQARTDATSDSADNWSNVQLAVGSLANYEVNSWGIAFGAINAQAAQYGQLGGKASARTGYAPWSRSSGGTASMHDLWDDLFTVTSSTLAIDTPVQLRLRVTLLGSILALNPDGLDNGFMGGGWLKAAFQRGGRDAPWITGVEANWGLVIGQDYGFGTRAVNLTNTAFVDAFVGRPLHLTGAMSLFYGQTSGPIHRDFYDGFAEGTARFYVDVVTPGTNYSTASGFSYVSATPVPEPASWALLAAGLLVVYRVRRQGRSASGLKVTSRQCCF